MSRTIASIYYVVYMYIYIVSIKTQNIVRQRNKEFAEIMTTVRSKQVESINDFLTISSFRKNNYLYVENSNFIFSILFVEIISQSWLT